MGDVEDERQSPSSTSPSALRAPSPSGGRQALSNARRVPRPILAVEAAGSQGRPVPAELSAQAAGASLPPTRRRARRRDASMPITVRKIHPLFGAEISGVDIREPVSVQDFGEIRAA